MITYNFIVETIRSGQHGTYEDSIYEYDIKSNAPQSMVKKFCMNVLKKSYNKTDMPNPFVGELIEFKCIGKRDGLDLYKYKVNYKFTG